MAGERVCFLASRAALTIAVSFDTEHLHLHPHPATVFEGRLVNRETGDYKGYPLAQDEWPAGIVEIYASHVRD